MAQNHPIDRDPDLAGRTGAHTDRHADVDRDLDRRHLFQEDIVRSGPARAALAGLRIVLGFTFLWPFLDKLFGLGYMTPSDKAMIHGGTPAQGFMKHVEGPFAGFFKGMAGPWADWLFMIALLCIGVAVLLGAGLKIAALSGSILLFLMYLAEFPIGQAGKGFTNPLFDSHWIEALGLVVLATTLAGDTLGIGRWWGRKVGNSFLR